MSIDCCVLLLFGIWVANKVTKPKEKTIIVEKEIRILSNDDFLLNEKELQERKISKRDSKS